MSNIGKNKIKIPAGVFVNIDSSKILIEGKLGKLEHTLSGDVHFELENNVIKSSSKDKMKWGTEHKLVHNAIIGVSKGFKKKLNLVGIGYRAQIQKKILLMKLGFSHDVEFLIPEGIDAICPKSDQIILLGIKKDFLNKTASTIRSLKKPDAYKGKGILFDNEILNLKEGKKK
jgi:large subunit ribosomal protein L6|tara:strand:- start:122 stop:640 length:519 start_codon:yes stop_codon:yes gene_type:complete